MESPTSAASRLDFYDFLDRMRRPAAADLFRSIKSFLVSFSFHEPKAEEDGRQVQAFLTEMESAIRDHPLWANATNQEIDYALEGLEKYIMTKLFDRTFGTSAEDAIIDVEISEKIGLLQQFVKPHHLDIPKVLQNEASWLLAVKELQKINSFKAPREKVLCIMSCCQVINNLLLNISMSNDRTLSGADEFLPILIYITIKANPPQLHSNLKFVQHFRRETKLISEDTSLFEAVWLSMDLYFSFFLVAFSYARRPAAARRGGEAERTCRGVFVEFMMKVARFDELAESGNRFLVRFHQAS